MWHRLKIEIKYCFWNLKITMELLNNENENLKKQPKLEDSQNKFETANQTSSVKWLTKPVLSTFQRAHSGSISQCSIVRSK